MSYYKDAVTVQGVGGAVDAINQVRADQYIRNIHFQDINLDGAIEQLNMARDFLGDPEHIVGSMATKHGEVAEVFDVRFGNADRIIRGEDPNYSFDGVGRTDATDYLKNNLPVQSKFVQSNLSMDAVLNHLEKYPDFVQSGGTYCIPKDFYEQIDVWMKMTPEELSRLPASEGGRLARNVVDNIKELEAKTGKSFNDLVEPSQVNYDQVQLKRAGNTIDAKEQEILDVDVKRREEYWKMAQASIKEGLKTAGIAAAISGVVSFGTSLISELKGQKKKLSELTKEDWARIFKQTGLDAVKGGVTGGSIYALTNLTQMSAPIAAALVSATLGVALQAIRLYKKEISFDDFMYNVAECATDTAVSAVGAIVGQLVIPVPVLGAVVGSIVSTVVLGLVKKHLFGGSYYDHVKEAGYEKEYSDEYRPLTEEFDKCSATFNQSLKIYTEKMDEFWHRKDGSDPGDVDLKQTDQNIRTSNRHDVQIY